MRLDVALFNQAARGVGGQVAQAAGVPGKIINMHDNAATLNPGIDIRQDGAATIHDPTVLITHSSNRIAGHNGEIDTARHAGSSGSATAKVHSWC
jgi:hypothetical protein